MVEIKTFFADDGRAQVLRSGTCAGEGKYVLYWMQRSQRGRENHALNAAIALANELALPVVVLFVVTPYPAANLRHYTFMLEGLAETARDLQKRGTPLVIREGEPAAEVIRLAQELSVAAVVNDFCELRTPRAWRAEVSQNIEVPYVCIDADTVVPMLSFEKEEWAAHTFRPKLQRLLPTYLQPIIDITPDYPLEKPPCAPGETANPLRYLDTLQIDRSVPASPVFHGGAEEGRRRVAHFLQERLDRYATQRNHPEIAGTSELSAYLHFGQISVQQLAWDIEHNESLGQTGLPFDRNGGRGSYLDELITWRELAINFALHNPHYDSLAGGPNWGRETLRKHASDLREHIYTRAEFEQAQTHDELWNACQREMVTTGRMHGYMRMYWAKKILEWSETPEEAYANAVYLNDKYEIDGRDANGYGGIAWSIAGKFDRPWPPEKPIFGLIRSMSRSGMERKMDTRYYINKYGHPLFQQR